MAIAEERPVGFGRLKRKEDPRFIRGQGTYLDDIRLPGMVYGQVLRSPYAHARIVSIDTSRALAHPGVAAVVTAKDLETLGLAWMPTISYDTQAVLAGDKVRFQGQEVAFVIATDEYTANDALALIDVEYDPLPPVVNARKALDDDAPLIRDDKAGQTDNLASPTWEAGDEAATDKAFAEADTIVSRDIIYPRCHPAPLETCGMIADFNPETGQLDIYNGNQAPHAHRTVYAHVAGLAEHMIRIKCNDIGGGFGNKVPVYPGYVCAIAGSIVAGVPVKWIEDRTGNLTSTGFARDYIMKAEMCAKDGKITGLRVDTIADHGAFDSTAQPTKFPAGFFHIVCGSYDLEASHVKVKAVYTNKAPGGVAYRCSFRITEAVYLVERMVDALALEMKTDPIDLRMGSFIKPEQFPYETTTGWTYDSGEYAETMKVAMDIAGYDDLRREQKEKRERGELMGIGVSFFTEGVGAGPRKHMDILGLAMNDGADLRVHPSGKAVVSISAQTQGQGHETTFAQIVAEELGIPPEDVLVRHGDTDRTPYGLGTYGSRSTPVSGAAVAVVSRKVRDKARAIAATMLETRPEDLAWEKGRWYVKGDPEKGAMIEEISRYAYSGEPMPEGQEGGLDAQVIYDPPNLTYPYGAYIAVVDVDPDTGAGDGAALHRGRRLRRAHQPDDRRRPDPRRARGGHRDRADGADLVRRRGQLPELVVHGLPDPDRARVPRLRARRDRHAVPAPPARRQGRRRVAQRRLAAGDRQRGHRRAVRVARRRPPRHALHAGPRVGGDAGAPASRRNDAARPSPGGRRSCRNRAFRSPPRRSCASSARRARSPATRRWCSQDGTIEGFVGGDCAEQSVREYALRAIESGESVLLRVVPFGGEEERGVVTVQNPCLSGGMIEVFVEPVVPAPRVLVEGDMPISHALLRLGGELGLDMVAVVGGEFDAAAGRSRAGRRGARARGAAGAQGRRSRRRCPTSAWWPAAAAGRACSASCAATACRRSCSTASTRPPASTSARARRRRSRSRSSPSIVAVRRSAGARRVTAIDPVCGMTVTVVPGTPSLEHEGETVYFCREGCKDAFERACRTDFACGLVLGRGRLEAPRAAEADAPLPRRDAARARRRRRARLRLRPADRRDRRGGRRGARAGRPARRAGGGQRRLRRGLLVVDRGGARRGGRALRRARADARRPAGRDGGDGARAARRPRRRGARGLPLRRRARASDRVRALAVRRAGGPARRQGRVEAGRPGSARTCRSTGEIPLDVDTPEDYAAVR